MALQGYLTGVSAAGTIANLGTVDDAVVGTLATLISGGIAISGTGSNQSVTVFGAVYGANTGIRLGAVGTFDNLVKIAASGQVSGDGAAVSITGKVANVINSGSVTGNNWGLFYQMDGDGLTYATNHGSITASTGIGVMGTTLALVENFGTITATNHSYYADVAVETRLKNHGTMIGDMNFGDLNDTLTSTGTIEGTLRMGEGNDSVTLRGDFDGLIILEEGNDSYDGRLSTAQSLRVIGDAGDDSFTMGNAEEAISGDDGIDSVNYYRTRANIQVTLEGFGGTGSGGAEGDTYYQIENVYAGLGNDRVIGSDDANWLSGNQGNDTLIGGLGDDTLNGDTGVDRMAGGGGNDAFYIYAVPTGGADIITDFSNVAGNNDVLQIYGQGLGGGLTTGPLAPSQFRSRNDHVAQDADDRFIFDKTDQSLWFDVDGNGAAAAVMLVDLQAGATFTLADIILL